MKVIRHGIRVLYRIMFSHGKTFLIKLLNSKGFICSSSYNLLMHLNVKLSSQILFEPTTLHSIDILRVGPTITIYRHGKKIQYAIHLIDF